MRAIELDISRLLFSISGAEISDYNIYYTNVLHKAETLLSLCSSVLRQLFKCK